jgi:peptidoglycan-N-acetylglucosamine deacetylase
MRFPVTIAGPCAWVSIPAVGLSIWFHALAALTLIAYPEWRRWLAGALAGNHLLLGAFGMRPRSRVIGANLVTLPRSNRAKAYVALTFDDGPDPNVTPRVLDVLDRHGTKARFFCIGHLASAHPEIVRDIVRRGHSVENHSHRHPYSFACYRPGSLIRAIDDALTAPSPLRAARRGSSAHRWICAARCSIPC